MHRAWAKDGDGFRFAKENAERSEPKNEICTASTFKSR